MKDTNFLAPKYKRLFAYLIDVVILAIPITIIYNIGLGDILPQIITIVSFWLYFAIMESSKSQGTVGKLIFRIKVVDQQGEAITFGKATLRHLGKMLSGLTVLIGFIMIFFTKKQQCLHDIIAKTLVIKKEASMENSKNEIKGEIPKTENKLNGESIGGWLIYLLIGLFGTIIVNFQTISQILSDEIISEIPLIGLFAILASLILITLAIFTIIFFFKKKKIAPSLYLLLMSSAIVLGFIILILILIATMIEKIDDDIGRILLLVNLAFFVRNIIQRVIWKTYFDRSKRVKATFVNELDEKKPFELIFKLSLDKILQPSIVKTARKIFKIAAISIGSLIVLFFIVRFSFRAIGHARWKNQDILKTAAEEGTIEKIKRFRKFSVNVNKTDYHENTVLHIAANNGNYEVAKKIISLGANINLQNKKGITPLHIALIPVKLELARENILSPASKINSEGKIKIVKLLIEKGANLNPTLENKMLVSPLYIAMIYTNEKAALLMIEKRAKLGEIPGQQNSLHLCAFSKKLTDYYYKEETNVNAQDKLGNIPLHYAKTAEVVQFYIENGVDINTTNHTGATAIHTLIKFGTPEAIQTLINAGADINIKDKNGDSPIIVAGKQNKNVIVELFIKNNATLSSMEGAKILFSAATHNNTNLIALLLETGVHINARIDHISKRTPLHAAIENCNLEATKLLLEKGARVNLKDKNGFTPLIYANNKRSSYHYVNAANKNEVINIDAIIELLLKYGAK